MAFDDRHVGDIEAAQLIDTIGHFEEAVEGVEPRLPVAAAGIDKKAEKFDRLPNQPDAVKQYLRAFAART